MLYDHIILSYLILMNLEGELNLDKYIEEVCKHTEIHPDGIIAEWKEYSEEEKKNPKPPISIEKSKLIIFKNYIRALIIQNWDPTKYITENKEGCKVRQFINMLRDNDLRFGILDKSRLVNHIKIISTHNNFPFLTANLIYAENIYSFIDSFNYDYKAAYIFGEDGTRHEKLRSDVYKKHYRYGIYFSIIDCEEKSDKTLNSLLHSKLETYFAGSVIRDKSPRWGLKQVVIFITNFHKADPKFQNVVFRLINSGLYYEHYRTEERWPGAFIVLCANNSPNITNYMAMPEEPNWLGEYKDNLVINLTPLRLMRYDIPLIVYHYSFNRDYYYTSKGKVLFPFILIKYWLTAERFPKNTEQLINEISDYTTKYFSLINDNPEFRLRSDNIEERKMIFHKLIKLPNNPSFLDYASNNCLEPYELVEREELIHRPYLYYALRYFNKKRNEWDFDPEIINKLLSLTSSTGLTEPRDLFGELYGIKVPKDFDNKPSSIKPIITQESENIEKDKRPKISPKTLAAIKPLNLPENYSWDNLSIKWSVESCVFHFLTDDSNLSQLVRTYKEMGFESLRPKGQPIKEWESVLGRLAEKNGRIYVEKNDRFLPQAIINANGRLAEFFKIKKNLIVKDEFDKRHPFYYSKFKIQKRTY